MFKIYSEDLRERVVAHVEAGHSCRATARYFDVGPSFVIKLLQRYRATGSLKPARRGQPPGKGKLAPYKVFLTDCVEAAPDMTLAELSTRLLEEHGVSAAGWSIARILKSAGYTYKKRWWPRNVDAQM